LVDDGLMIEEDDFPLAPLALPEIEPESRYIHGILLFLLLI